MRVTSIRWDSYNKNDDILEALSRNCLDATSGKETNEKNISADIPNDLAYTGNSYW